MHLKANACCPGGQLQGVRRDDGLQVGDDYMASGRVMKAN